MNADGNGHLNALPPRKDGKPRHQKRVYEYSNHKMWAVPVGKTVIIDSHYWDSLVSGREFEPRMEVPNYVGVVVKFVPEVDAVVVRFECEPGTGLPFGDEDYGHLYVQTNAIVNKDDDMKSLRGMSVRDHAWNRRPTIANYVTLGYTHTEIAGILCMTEYGTRKAIMGMPIELCELAFPDVGGLRRG